MFVLGAKNTEQADVEELRRNSNAFVTIALRKESELSRLGGVVWNHGELVIGETEPYVARYKLRGPHQRRGSQAGVTPLPGAGYYHAGFSISGNRLVEPSTDADSVFLYDYPAGKTLKKITGFGEPLAAGISSLQQRYSSCSRHRGGCKHSGSGRT